MKTTVKDLKRVINEVAHSMSEAPKPMWQKGQDAEGLAQEFKERFPDVVEGVDVANNGVMVYLKRKDDAVRQYVEQLRAAGCGVKVSTTPEGPTVRVWVR